jgi:hypothetical protein
MDTAVAISMGHRSRKYISLFHSSLQAQTQRSPSASFSRSLIHPAPSRFSSPSLWVLYTLKLIFQPSHGHACAIIRIYSENYCLHRGRLSPALDVPRARTVLHLPPSSGIRATPAYSASSGIAAYACSAMLVDAANIMANIERPFLKASICLSRFSRLYTKASNINFHQS